MKPNRKVALGVGVALSIAGVFWMRARVSWRPVTVAKVSFPPEQLRFSPNGKFLLTKNKAQAVILNLENGEVDDEFSHIRNFDKNQGLETFPRVWFENSTKQLIFSKTPEKKIVLSSPMKNEADLMAFEEGRFHLGWSKERGEVFVESEGEIHIWNVANGQLKQRLRYAKTGDENAIFSPDGKWLMAIEKREKEWFYLLRRYDVQSGEMMAIEKIFSFRPPASSGFSADGRFFWCVQGASNSREIVVLRVGKSWRWKSLWDETSVGPVKWLPDGRVGMVQADGFQWRDESGRLIRQLPGPFQTPAFQGQPDYMVDWALSPDGDWIYSAHRDGVIRRWRAR